MNEKNVKKRYKLLVIRSDLVWEKVNQKRNKWWVQKMRRKKANYLFLITFNLLLVKFGLFYLLESYILQ